MKKKFLVIIYAVVLTMTTLACCKESVEPIEPIEFETDQIDDTFLKCSSLRNCLFA